MGVIGLAAFAWLYRALFRTATGGASLGEAGLGPGVRLGVVGALAGFLAAGLFEWNFGDEELLDLLYALVGIAWAARRLVVTRRRAGEPLVKLALVHDWLTGMRGGEKVLERIARHVPGSARSTPWSGSAARCRPRSSPIRSARRSLQHLPDAARRYRWFLPLYPRRDRVASTSRRTTW